MAHDLKHAQTRSMPQSKSAIDTESLMLMIHTMKEQMDSMQTMMKARLEAADATAQNMAKFETFVRRRFDEISMEINATSQQLDMAEEGFGSRFGEILNNLAAISYNGTGATAANTGVELQAVIDDTEQAANTILDAADRIAQRLHDPENFQSEESLQQFLAMTDGDVQGILMACSFQDLAGQRIRKILESLEIIEERITSTLGEMGIDTTPDAMAGGVEDSTKGHASSQADIDALFS